MEAREAGVSAAMSDSVSSASIVKQLEEDDRNLAPTPPAMYSLNAQAHCEHEMAVSIQTVIDRCLHEHEPLQSTNHHSHTVTRNHDHINSSIDQVLHSSCQDQDNDFDSREYDVYTVPLSTSTFDHLPEDFLDNISPRSGSSAASSDTLTPTRTLNNNNGVGRQSLGTFTSLQPVSLDTQMNNGQPQRKMSRLSSECGYLKQEPAECPPVPVQLVSPPSGPGRLLPHASELLSGCSLKANTPTNTYAHGLHNTLKLESAGGSAVSTVDLASTMLTQMFPSANAIHKTHNARGAVLVRMPVGAVPPPATLSSVPVSTGHPEVADTTVSATAISHSTGALPSITIVHKDRGRKQKLQTTPTASVSVCGTPSNTDHDQSTLMHGNQQQSIGQSCSQQARTQALMQQLDETDDDIYIDTRELCHRIAYELKQNSIPQAVFAEKILGRSQGTLSDLLRNPKPWNKLKSGRETFRRMYNWLKIAVEERLRILQEHTNNAAAAVAAQNSQITSNSTTVTQQSTNHKQDTVPSGDRPISERVIDVAALVAAQQLAPKASAAEEANFESIMAAGDLDENDETDGRHSNASSHNADAPDNDNDTSPKQRLNDGSPGPLHKRQRLVFTDIQKRTLQAIFRETQRPSREMQQTIAEHLQLDLSTVANFFMNARRRSRNGVIQTFDTPEPYQHVKPITPPPEPLHAPGRPPKGRPPRTPAVVPPVTQRCANPESIARTVEEVAASTLAAAAGADDTRRLPVTAGSSPAVRSGVTQSNHTTNGSQHRLEQRSVPVMSLDTANTASIKSCPDEAANQRLEDTVGQVLKRCTT